MPAHTNTSATPATNIFDAQPDTRILEAQLLYLRLPTIRQHAAELCRQAAGEGWDHLRFLSRLIEIEARSRHDKSAQPRIRSARFPVIKTLETFDWNWPKKVPRQTIESLLDLGFLQRKENILFFGNPGLGKTHLATAIGYAAALAGKSVLFANTIDVVNRLQSAVAAHNLRPHSDNTPAPNSSSSTNSDTSLSTNMAETFSSKSSAHATNAHPSS